MKKILSLVLAIAMLLCVAVAEEAAAPMTYEEFLAAELDSPVTVKTYIQLIAYNAAYGTASMFLGDEEGAYFVYRMACDEALAAELYEGAPVIVSGEKTEWSGEVEIIDATIELLDEEGALFESENINEVLGTEDIDLYKNALVTVSDVTVVAYNEAGDAFSYNWDGSGAAGSNSDLYFNVQLGDTVYSMTVESDECAEGTDVYTAVTSLKVGDVIDVTGFLYWYNGAQIHVNEVIVK